MDPTCDIATRPSAACVGDERRTPYSIPYLYGRGRETPECTIASVVADRCYRGTDSTVRRVLFAALRLAVLGLAAPASAVGAAPRCNGKPATIFGFGLLPIKIDPYAREVQSSPRSLGQGCASDRRLRVPGPLSPEIGGKESMPLPSTTVSTARLASSAKSVKPA